MKKQLNNLLTIETIDKLQENIFAMTLGGDCSRISAPGQFINIRLDGFYLRRPISICSWDEQHLIIVFKVVGQGTAAMAKMRPGEKLDVLMPLGNGFDTEKCGEKPLLAGGGIGVPPLYGLARALVKKQIQPKVVLGFNTREDVILTEAFRNLGLEPIIATADGSEGVRGFVTDAMKDLDFDYLYTCGPEPMLKAVWQNAPDGQFSFEARMACGFGACMGCSCETKYGYKRICKDGPVLFKEEIKW